MLYYVLRNMLIWKSINNKRRHTVTILRCIKAWFAKVLKDVPSHALITWNTFQFKQKSMTNVVCFNGQQFSYLDGI